MSWSSSTLAQQSTSMLNRHCDNMAETPRLDAIYVAVDGSIKAVYDDNTLLVLSADGSSFTYISPAGARTVQLCEFCLSRFTPLLTELLDFRNQHVDTPAVSRPLLQQLQRSSQTFTLHFPITYTCWPATAAEAFQHGLVELPDSTRIAVLSKCGYARIMLEYTGLRFAVRYPLLVAHDPASSSYTYTWQLQVFSRSLYPQRWQPALAIASAVADSAAHGFRLQDSPQQHQPAPQLFADLTNQQRHHQQWSHGGPSAVLRASSACSSPVRHCSPSRAPGSTCSSPRRYGSPLQQQHKAWQQQQQSWGGCEWPAAASPTAHAAAGSSQCTRTRFQQQQQQAGRDSGQPAAAGLPQGAAAGSGSSAFITQLPISADLMQALPTYLQPQHQQQHTTVNSTCSSSQGRIAAGLAQALGHRQGLAAAPAAAAAAGPGRGWWMEPSLLLPSDELLQMVWMRDATILFVQEVEEVEVWLHADDSCMFSFQAGNFVTHLLPRAAAAGWDAAAATAAACTPAAAAAGSGEEQLLPHAAEPRLSSWHEARDSHSSSAAAGHLAPGMTAAAAAADGTEPLSLQLRHLRLPAGHGAAAADRAAAGAAAWVTCGSLGHTASPRAAVNDICGADGLTDGAIDASQMSRVYAATALPEVPVAAVADGCGSSAGIAAGCGGPALKLPVGQVAARALKFRSTMVRVKRCLVSLANAAVQEQDQQARPQLPWQAQQHTQQQQLQQLCLDTEVLEEQQVPGVGRFTATKDGRVRVRFDDRTILNLAADAGSADLVTRDGSRRTVATSNPMGVKEYVQAALEFAAWAHTSPAKRAAALRMQALVAAELRSSARMAAICEWGAEQRLPAQAAAAHSAAASPEAAADAAWDAAAGNDLYDDFEGGGAAGWQHGAGAGLQHSNMQHLEMGVPAGVPVQDERFPRSWASGGGNIENMQHEQWPCSAASLSSSMVAGMPGLRQQVVEDVLQANARLLQKLAS